MSNPIADFMISHHLKIQDVGTVTIGTAVAATVSADKALQPGSWWATNYLFSNFSYADLLQGVGAICAFIGALNIVWRAYRDFRK